MKSALFIAVALSAALPARAEDWTVRMKAVNGRQTYSVSLKNSPGRQAAYDGKAGARGPGASSDVIFKTYLDSPREGVFRLDYQAEVAGKNRARPPFQAAGKVLLLPGKPVLAADAGGWKLILELEGEYEGKPPRPGSGVLDAKLKCGRYSYPVSFAYLPNEQYSAVVYGGSDEEPLKFMIGLLPAAAGADGEFELQYTLQLKEGAETLADSSGSMVLEPGGPRPAASAGKGCVFSAKASR
ncbi:MAG: hypothetical protein M0025_12475 [Elusimicrobia bacterium]|nr:hypothetical protein [Elusimicrobiota bacterium]